LGGISAILRFPVILEEEEEEESESDDDGKL